MAISPHEIITDAEIDRVHGHANFGDMSKRSVVNEGLLKYAFGFTSGFTQLSILIEHGLVRKPLPGSYSTTLTKKGFKYLQAVFGRNFPSIIALDVTLPPVVDAALSNMRVVV